jgi:hypothetical protein
MTPVQNGSAWRLLGEKGAAVHWAAAPFYVQNLGKPKRRRERRHPCRPCLPTGMSLEFGSLEKGVEKGMNLV